MTIEGLGQPLGKAAERLMVEIALEKADKDPNSRHGLFAMLLLIIILLFCSPCLSSFQIIVDHIHLDGVIYGVG